MTKIVVDSPLKTQLAALVEPVEVIDDDGRSLGLFVPAEAMHTPDNCRIPMKNWKKCGISPPDGQWRKFGNRSGKMIFTVTWSPRADKTLAGLWVDVQTAGP